MSKGEVRMVDTIINIALLVAALASAFAWGYEKGRGDAMQEEIDYIERKLKQREAEKSGE